MTMRKKLALLLTIVLLFTMIIVPARADIGKPVLPTIEQLQKNHGYTKEEAEQRLNQILAEEEYLKQYRAKRHDQPTEKEIIAKQAIIDAHFEKLEMRELQKRSFSSEEQMAAKRNKTLISFNSSKTTSDDALKVSLAAAGVKTISMPFYQQINNYFCGPAATQMALAARGVLHTQEALGNQWNLNTYNLGSTRGIDIKNTLNNRLGTTWYVYQDLEGVNLGIAELERRVKVNIDNRYAPVIAVYQSGNIPNWGLVGHEGKYLRHFIPLDGYDTGVATGTRTLHYKDPVAGRFDYPGVKFTAGYWYPTDDMRRLSIGGSITY